MKTKKLQIWKTKFNYTEKRMASRAEDSGRSAKALKNI